MSSRTPTLLQVLLFALATLAAPAACSSTVQPAEPTSSSSGSGGAAPGTSSGNSGNGGDGLSLSIGGGGGAAPCGAFPSDGGDAGASIALQAFCEPGAINPADCPATKPTLGDPCPSTSNGLQCAYERDAAGYVLQTCAGSWSSSQYVWCSQDCTSSAPEVPVASSPACGSLPEIPCVTFPEGTDQERANATLRQIGECCPAHTETKLVVWLQDGCATASAGRPDLVACMNSLLAGRRIQCAAALSCTATEWSTLP